MKVLIAHVRYRHRGGEDAVVEQEILLLRESGVEVESLILDSSHFDALPMGERLAIAVSQGDHAYGRRVMRAAIDRHAPDVVHAHNLFPLLGPGALIEASQAGCATVHTWHNYRASCLAGTHLLDGEVCVRCDVNGRIAGVMHGCYRDSKLQSLAYERGVRGQMRAFAKDVPDAVLCLTDFQRRFYMEQGIPGSSLVVKPNSVAEGKPLPWQERNGVVFVGRMSREKGILGLTQAWPLEAPLLTVIGDGPLLAQVRNVAEVKSNILVVGALSAADTRAAIRMARTLAFPSTWFEGLPLTVLESMAEGTPVVTFRGGAVEGLIPAMAVHLGDFGAFIQTSESVALAAEDQWQQLSSECLRIFREHYTNDTNAAALVRIYRELCEER